MKYTKIHWLLCIFLSISTLSILFTSALAITSSALESTQSTDISLIDVDVLKFPDVLLSHPFIIDPVVYFRALFINPFTSLDSESVTLLLHYSCTGMNECRTPVGDVIITVNDIDVYSLNYRSVSPFKALHEKLWTLSVTFPLIKPPKVPLDDESKPYVIAIRFQIQDLNPLNPRTDFATFDLTLKPTIISADPSNSIIKYTSKLTIRDQMYNFRDVGALNATTSIIPSHTRPLLSTQLIPTIPSIKPSTSTRYLDWSLSIQSSPAFGTRSGLIQPPPLLVISPFGPHWFVFNQTNPIDANTTFKCSINGVKVTGQPIFTSDDATSAEAQFQRQTRVVLHIEPDDWDLILPRVTLNLAYFEVNCYGAVVLATNSKIKASLDDIGGFQLMLPVDLSIETLGRLARVFFPIPSHNEVPTTPTMLTTNEYFYSHNVPLKGGGSNGNTTLILAPNTLTFSPVSPIPPPPSLYSSQDRHGMASVTFPLQFALASIPPKPSTTYKHQIWFEFVGLGMTEVDSYAGRGPIYITIEVPSTHYKAHTYLNWKTQSTTQDFTLPSIDVMYNLKTTTTTETQPINLAVIITATFYGTMATVNNTNSDTLDNDQQWQNQVIMHYHPIDTKIKDIQPLTFIRNIPIEEFYNEAHLLEEQRNKANPDQKLTTLTKTATPNSLGGYDFFVLNTTHPHYYFYNINHTNPISEIALHVTGRWQFQHLNQTTPEFQSLLSKSIRCNQGSVECVIFNYQVTNRTISFHVDHKQKTKLSTILSSTPAPIIAVEINLGFFGLVHYSYSSFQSTPDLPMPNNDEPMINFDPVIVSTYLLGATHATYGQRREPICYSVYFTHAARKLPPSAFGALHVTSYDHHHSLSVVQILFLTSGAVLLFSLIVIITIKCTKNFTTCISTQPETNEFDYNPGSPHSPDVGLREGLLISTNGDNGEDINALFQDALQHIGGSGIPPYDDENVNGVSDTTSGRYAYGAPTPPRPTSSTMSTSSAKQHRKYSIHVPGKDPTADGTYGSYPIENLPQYQTPKKNKVMHIKYDEEDMVQSKSTVSTRNEPRLTTLSRMASE